MTTYRVWHGTCKSFKQFNLRSCSPESFCGRGYYFSDCINDASTYAVSSHPDHVAKIENKRYQLIDKGVSYHTAQKKAEEVYNTSRLLECELTIKKPLEFWKEGAKVYVQRRSFKRLTKLLSVYRVDEQDSESALNLTQALLDGVNTSELLRLIVSCGLSVFPQVVRALGYDGCIMHDTLSFWPRWYKHQANHYIVYNRRQIKVNNDTQPVL